jgi:general secretion pathway protein E
MLFSRRLDSPDAPAFRSGPAPTPDREQSLLPFRPGSEEAFNADSPDAAAPDVEVVVDMAKLPPGRYLPFAEFPGHALPASYEAGFALLATGEASILILRTREQVASRIEFEIGARCADAGFETRERMAVSHEIVKALHASFHAEHDHAILERSEIERCAFDLIAAAVQTGASDIHVETRGGIARVFFRIHGERFEQPNLATPTAMAILRVLYNVHADRQNSGTNWDPNAVQDTAVEHVLATGERVQLRFNSAPIYPAPNIQCTLRVLRMDGDMAARELDAVGYTPQMVRAIDDMLIGSTGLVLLVGPTNSGKSTSLQSFVQRIYQRRGASIKVVTIEDPVEYLISRACQMGVPRGKLAPHEIARIYRELLGSTLRQDPDVALVGEIRSSEQAEPVKDLVLAGRKILSTLHAYEALAVFPRLREIGVPMSLLARPGFISGVIYQRLVPLLCPDCSLPARDAFEAGSLLEGTWERVLDVVNDGGETVRARNRHGCAKCNFTGIVGRTPCAELLVPDEEFLRLLRKDDELAARNHWHRTGINTDGAGVRVMAHAISKLRRGLVDPTDVEVQIGSIAIDPPRRDQRHITSGGAARASDAGGSVSPWTQASFTDMGGPQPAGAVDAAEGRLN